jgi:hypothetical protein
LCSSFQIIQRQHPHGELLSGVLWGYALILHAFWCCDTPLWPVQVADAGTLSGTGEAIYLLGLLQNKYSAPGAAIPCQSMSTGTLFGHAVAVITSGGDSMHCIASRHGDKQFHS